MQRTGCTQIRCLRSDQSVNNVNSVSAYGSADTEQHTLFTYVIYGVVRFSVMQIYTGKIQSFQLESTGMEILCDGE